MAPPATGKTTPPIPHVAVAAEIPEPEKAAAPIKPRRKRGVPKVAIFGAAAVVVLAGGFFAWQKFMSPPPPPPAPPTVKKPAVTATTPPATPAAPAATPTPGPTPSDTLNAIAKAPVNAVNKAQNAVAVRNASGQLQVDPSEDLANKPAAPAAAPKASPAVAPKASVAVTNVAPGVSATIPVDAAAEASPAFRSFVANAKIGSVVGGSEPKMILNGRLARGGEVVDFGLGVTFDRVDDEKRLLIFKDKSGATVTRRY